MDMAVSAVILYAVVASYLSARRVPWTLIGRILLTGLAMGMGAGLLTPFVAGFLLSDPPPPPDIFAICSMAGLLLVAAYLARDHILGTITPAEVVFLNIAANLAPPAGPIPINFLWLARLLADPSGETSLALNLLVLYWPALFALWMLAWGPPGNVGLRLILGIWVVWIGMGIVSGPAWEVVGEVRLDHPAMWVASGIAVYAVMHSLMLAINLFMAQVDDNAVSIARSVRVNGMKPWLAAGCGIAFWAASYQFVGAAHRLSPEIVAACLVAAAFGLGSLLAPLFPARKADDPALEQDSQGLGGLVTAALVVVAFFGSVLWSTHAFDRRSFQRARVDPATGESGNVRVIYPMYIRYPDDRRQAIVAQRLAKAGVPYARTRKDGVEHLVVGGEHQAAVLKVLASIKADAGVFREAAP